METLWHAGWGLRKVFDMLGILALLFGLVAVGAGAAVSGSSQAATTENDDTDPDMTDPDQPDTVTEDFEGITDTAAAFYAAGGQLVLEAESGEASGYWEQVQVDGETAMLWDADNNSYGQARDGEELSFEFVTEEAGTYFIAMHTARVQSAQDPDDVRSDTGNDAWVKVTNLETGEVILDPTKLFTVLGNSDQELKWGRTFDENHVKSDAQVTLEGDTAYKLELIGRSDGHVIDRVTLSTDGALRDTEALESMSLMEALTIESATLSVAGPDDEMAEAEVFDLV